MGTVARFNPAIGSLSRKECTLIQNGYNIPVTNANRKEYVMMLAQTYCLAGAEESIMSVSFLTVVCFIFFQSYSEGSSKSDTCQAPILSRSSTYESTSQRIVGDRC